MIYPTREDFLIAFGIEPVKVDGDLGLYHYLLRSNEEDADLEISFSSVYRSFQATIIFQDRTIATISSEMVAKIELNNDIGNSMIRVIFEINGLIAEAVVKIEPKITLHWWILKNF